MGAEAFGDESAFPWAKGVRDVGGVSECYFDKRKGSLREWGVAGGDVRHRPEGGEAGD